MKSRFSVLLSLVVFCHPVSAGSLSTSNAARIALAASTNACWWAGVIDHGFQMPLTGDYDANLSGDTYGNQGQPLLLSNQGDVIWSEDPIAIQLSHGRLVVEAKGGELKH